MILGGKYGRGHIGSGIKGDQKRNGRTLITRQHGAGELQKKRRTKKHRDEEMNAEKGGPAGKKEASQRKIPSPQQKMRHMYNHKA